VSLRVKQGSIVALIGANGAGKSTLLKSTVGLVTPTAGEVWINGRSATAMRPHDFVRVGVALVPEGRQVFPGMSVLGNLQLGAYRRSSQGQRKGVERALQTFPALANRTNQLAGSLSGGEQQMLAIGRALASDPQILLIDELSLGLSPVLVEELLKTLKEISSQGVTVFVVEQDVETAIELASHLYALEAGQLVFSGTPDAIRSEQSARKLYLGL
jgi:branched-chain amino acid transport system ATP-binding protein